MTGWIKMSVNLRTHPKVVRLTSTLKADKNRVLGGLFSVWCVFDAHSEAGILEGYTLEAMDAEIGWRGFSAALKTLGWLEPRADGLHAPRFEEHNGATAKRRALDSSRKGKTRHSPDKSPPPVRIESGQTSASKPGQMSASDPDTLRNREEKRREEKKDQEKKIGDPLAAVASDRPLADRPALEVVAASKPAPKPEAKPEVLDCPHAELLALWAEELPQMPQPKAWTTTRAGHLRARWRETAVAKGWKHPEEGLAHFRRLFRYVGKSPFLTGRSRQTDPGRPPFIVELPWLLKPENYAKVIEGKYHAEEAAG